MRGKEVPAMKRALFVKLPALCAALLDGSIPLTPVTRPGAA